MTLATGCAKQESKYKFYLYVTQKETYALAVHSYRIQNNKREGEPHKFKVYHEAQDRHDICRANAKSAYLVLELNVWDRTEN